MRHYFTWPRAAVAVAGALLVAASVKGALAITETSYNYTNPQVGFFSINAMAMSPADTNSANFYAIGPGTATMTVGNDTSCFVTGVNLPNGAIINQLAVWYTGSASSGNAGVTLVRSSNDGTNVFLVAQDLTSQSGQRRQASFSITASPESTVNNASFSYGLGVCVNLGDAFHAARIRYTYTNAGS